MVILLNLMGANDTDSFNFKAKVTGQTRNNGPKNVKIMVPLEYLSNFWRTLEITLINCEINLILTCFENCVIVYINVANQGVTSAITLCFFSDSINSR